MLKPTRKEPPRRDKWFEFLAPIAADPGVWYSVRTFEKAGSAYNARAGLACGRLSAPAGKWSFRVSGRELYARFDGPLDVPAAVEE